MCVSRARLTAVGLIGSVLAVVLLIARPAHGDAAAAGAGKEVDWTFELSLVCKERSGNEKKEKEKGRRNVKMSSDVF